MKNTKTCKIICKILYAASIVLAAAFVISIIVDRYTYDNVLTSAPFYAAVLARTVEFLLPGVIALVAAIIINKKIKNNSSQH
ncbi:MAG TPA: hypothetical protein IAA24_07860 [Candidatus Eubacterium faecigallinarum]|nr:hypothetical protein [Candidatus Eubacterium faecigallinarum]